MNSIDHSVSQGLAPLSRRSLLRGFAVTGMFLSAGCTRLFRRRDVQQASYRFLTPEEARTLEKLATVFLPTERHGLPSALEDVPTMQYVDNMVGQMSTQMRELLALALWIFENRPMVSARFSRFSAMDDEAAARYVRAMQQGAFFERGITSTLKTLVTVNYWRDARTWPALDYWGPVTEKWGVRRLGNAPLPDDDALEGTA